MEPLPQTVPAQLRVRRAKLVDVPAVARLLGAPRPDWTGDPGGSAALTDLTIPTATRLVLTHVGLEVGEFWVAVGPADQIHAAVVLLPPAQSGDQHGLRVAVHLELGLLALPDLGELAAAPEGHWLMLAGAAAGDEGALRALLAAALPAVDDVGAPILSLQPALGLPSVASAALTAVGFVPLESAAASVSAALRPAAPAPARV